MSAGRSQPHPIPPPDGAEHDVRFYGGTEGGIPARCAPCRWSVALEGGHGPADLAELVRQHEGAPAVETLHACHEGEQMAAIRDVLEVADFGSGEDALFAIGEIDQILRGDR